MHCPRLQRPLISVMVALLAGSTPAWAKTKLVFATRGGAFNAAGVELRAELANALIKEFEAQNPDIDVEWLKVPDNNYSDKIVSMFAAGQAPDVMEAWGTMGTAWAEKGFLLDLEPFVRKDLRASDINDIFANVWQAPIVRVGPRAGMRYGVPRYLNVVIFYYNKTLFNQAGLMQLDQLDEAGAWNWNTLVEYGRKLTRKDPDGKYTQFALKTDRGISRSAAWVWANGGNVFRYPEAPTQFALDQPEAIEAFQYLYDLRWQYDVWPKGAPSFTTGLVAMDNTIASDSLAALISQIGTNFEWDVAQRPMGKKERGTRTSLDLYVVSSQTKNPEAAWRFVRFLISPKAQLLHAQIQGMVPIRKSLYRDFIALDRRKSLRHFFEAAITAHVDPVGVMARADDAVRLIDGALQASLENNAKPVKQAIDEVAAAVRALYAQ